jgi:hypothetical protein
MSHFTESHPIYLSSGSANQVAYVQLRHGCKQSDWPCLTPHRGIHLSLCPAIEHRTCSPSPLYQCQVIHSISRSWVNISQDRPHTHYIRVLSGPRTLHLASKRSLPKPSKDPSLINPISPRPLESHWFISLLACSRAILIIYPQVRFKAISSIYPQIYLRVSM